MLIVAPGQGHNRNIFSNFFYVKVCCVFLFKSPHRGDSNEYTQYTIFNMNKRHSLSFFLQFCSYEIFLRYSRTTINEPSDGWMDDLQFYVLFNSVSVISGRRDVDNERLCTMEHHIRLRRFRLKRG